MIKFRKTGFSAEPFWTVLAWKGVKLSFSSEPFGTVLNRSRFEFHTLQGGTVQNRSAL